MKRSNMKRKRATPRRREAPRFEREEWDEASMLLFARSRGRCECCGQLLEGRAERHHRERRRDGGDRLSNLLLLLPEHHARVTHNPQWARERGLIVSALADVEPADVPVHLWGETWVKLDDEGGCQRVEPPQLS